MGCEPPVSYVCRHEEVSLIPVIDDVMQQVMPFVQEGVVVYKRVYDLPQITGDSGRIEQVKTITEEYSRLLAKWFHETIAMDGGIASALEPTNLWQISAGAIQLDEQRSQIHTHRVHTCGSRLLT